MISDDGENNFLNNAMNSTGNKPPEYFTFINTNSRSLCPKMNAFIDTFKEMEASLAVVTETWMRNVPALEDDLDDLLHGAGIGMLTKNRRTGRRGIAHGGVAIAYRAAVMSMKEIKLSNPMNF